MHTRKALFLIGLAVLVLGVIASARDASIAASATAGSDYRRVRDARGNLAPESYVFAEGRYFGGTTRDGSLERMTFARVTQMLAPSLAKQNYLPASKLESADLVIMVHWGATEIYEDPMRDLHQDDLNNAVSNYNASIAESGTADPSALNMALGDRETAQNFTLAAINRNAALLGYARHLEKARKLAIPSEEERTMVGELAEERYFVILFAYDNRTRLKDKKPRLLWVTRLSVRSPGTNFTEALPALAKVGASVFGQQHDDLMRVDANLRQGTVKLGELEVIGTANELPPEKARQR